MNRRFRIRLTVLIEEMSGLNAVPNGEVVEYNYCSDPQNFMDMNTLFSKIREVGMEVERPQ
jgi:hypothetical protein